MTPGIPTAIFLGVEILGIASAIHALFTVRTTQGTIAWVIGLVTFPWLALPLYGMFGCRKFTAYADAMRAARSQHQDTLAEAARRMAPHQVSETAIAARDAGPLAAIAGERYMAGDRLDLLIDGQATFDAILEAVATAKQSVCLIFYIMREDGLGGRLLEALAERAQQGVSVHFLIDSLGSLSLRKADREKWRRRGVRLETFCATSSWRDRWRLNFRNHRKIVVVDGRIGFIGGHNVGDEYLGLDPAYGRWRDTHARVEGPTALQLQMVFASDWLFATGEKLPFRWDAHRPAEAGAQHALVLASGPADDFERCTLFFLHVISMARRRLWIASPYFVPDEGIMTALQLAATRGVEVRILLPHRADELLVWLASLALLKEMRHPNIHIHRYTGGFLHQKTLVVDDDFAAIGSANFDNRSFRLNFEATLAVAGAEFAGRVSAMLERDFEESVRVGPEDFDDRSRPVQAAAKVARLLAPIL